MIECIFISDFSNKLLFGDHPTLPSLGYYKGKLTTEKAIEQLTIVEAKQPPFLIQYPITDLQTFRIAHLKVNDVILNVLYNNLDSFQVAKFLLDLKNYFEEKITTLTIATTLKHYFSLVELLQTPEISFLPKKTKKNSNEKILIDIVQNIHCVTAGNHNNINTLQGTIFLDHLGIDALELTIEKKKSMLIKSTQKIQPYGDQVKIVFENIEQTSLLSFQQKHIDITYFKMKKAENLITIESEYSGIFKHIEVLIPLGVHTYKVDTKTSKGTCEFDITSGTLYWRFKDVYFLKETVKFNIFTLENDKDELPITINFRIDNPNKSSLKIKKVVNPKFPDQEFWVRNTIQNGYYELNDNK